MTKRHRYMMLFRTAADHKGTVSVSPSEAEILVELLRTGEPQTQNTWAHESLRVALAMLGDFEGDTLEEKIETLLRLLRRREAEVPAAKRDMQNAMDLLSEYPGATIYQRLSAMMKTFEVVMADARRAIREAQRRLDVAGGSDGPSPPSLPPEPPARG